MSYSMDGIKANTRLRVKKHVDLVLKNLKLKVLGPIQNEVLLITDPRYKHYKAKEHRIILKDGLLFRKFFGETSSIKYYQLLKPKQLFIEVMRNLQGESVKHPGITKTINAHTEKNCFPKLKQLIREWVVSCEKRIRKSAIDRNLTRPPLQNPNEHVTETEDAMQIDLVPKYLYPVAMKTLSEHGRVLPLFVCLSDIQSRRQISC